MCVHMCVCVGTLGVSDGYIKQHVETSFSVMKLITPVMPQQKKYKPRRKKKRKDKKRKDKKRKESD